MVLDQSTRALSSFTPENASCELFALDLCSEYPLLQITGAVLLPGC